MTNLMQSAAEIAAGLEDTYRDLHRNPELSGQEERTAGIAAAGLRDAGFEVIEGVGGYGVVGILRNGEGQVVWLRADMDALPMKEESGLDYASEATAKDDAGNTVPLAHSCGHDVHVTALMGAAALMSRSLDTWSGTLVTIFQPAEETVSGALAMLDDGLLEKAPKPDVVLGQHVMSAPAGALMHKPGPLMAGADSMNIKLFGAGGHGGQPNTTIDPVVMAASLILRLQTIVSRNLSPRDEAVVTVGTVHAGTKVNIIPDEAVLQLSIRTYDAAVRDNVIALITRMANAEALAAGAPREPEIEITETAPPTINDEPANARIATAFSAAFPLVIQSPITTTSSEDFGLLGTAAGVPSVYWMLGGADPKLYAQSTDLIETFLTLPSNHAPSYAPVIAPTLMMGVAALAVAAHEWLGVEA
jgi:amidohydrolase